MYLFVWFGAGGTVWIICLWLPLSAIFIPASVVRSTSWWSTTCGQWQLISTLLKASLHSLHWNICYLMVIDWQPHMISMLLVKLTKVLCDSLTYPLQKFLWSTSVYLSSLENLPLWKTCLTCNKTNLVISTHSAHLPHILPAQHSLSTSFQLPPSLENRNAKLVSHYQ